MSLIGRRLILIGMGKEQEHCDECPAKEECWEYVDWWNNEEIQIKDFCVRF